MANLTFMGLIVKAKKPHRFADESLVLKNEHLYMVGLGLKINVREHRKKLAQCFWRRRKPWRQKAQVMQDGGSMDPHSDRQELYSPNTKRDYSMKLNKKKKECEPGN